VSPEGAAGGSPNLTRRALFPDPVVDGRAKRDRSLSRFTRRVQSLLVSRVEREEAELERRLRRQPALTRPNLIAIVSPKGGVGKTVTTFLAGNLLASHLKLRAIAVDADPGFGTLGRLPAERLRPGRSREDLLDQADRIATAAELRRYVACLPSGLHLLAAPDDSGPGLEPDRFGELVALASCFYDAVLLDVGTGLVGPLARLAIERADQLVLVTTPSELAVKLAADSLGGLETERTTVVVNRTHPRLAREVRAVEEWLSQRDLHRTVAVPDDRRLAMMLDTGAYSLEALDRRTRLAVKRLGLALREQLV
jgi:MinD-like ATPase involved in chromosome partitioning or flagellar assembly